MLQTSRAGRCPRQGIRRACLIAGIALASIFIPSLSFSSWAQTSPRDPGVRAGAAGAGGPLAGLTTGEQALFEISTDVFQEVQSVTGELLDNGNETEAGLGPRFNLDGCAGCHQQPAIGGTSPAVNPQVVVARKAGATNALPFFVTVNGPVREARFKFHRDGTRDGGVQALFTIKGRSDATGCNLAQPDFNAADTSGNLALRIPTPLFGLGLVEAIDDATIRANQKANSQHQAPDRHRRASQSERQ